jgi:hypothetical protein
MSTGPETCIGSGATSGDGPLHRWQEMYKEDRKIRLMEHALGRVRQDSLHRQREDEGPTFLLMSCTIGGRLRSEARVSNPTAAC